MEAVGFLLIVVVVIWILSAANKPATESEVDRKAGEANLVCPHCQHVGTVSTKPTRVKRGISGGKVTGAVLTGGLSMLATGLSRKEYVTEVRCSHCRMVWHVE